MLQRQYYQEKISRIFSYAPICAMLGPRQCGKSTLARLYIQSYAKGPITTFDLENNLDLDRLEDPLLNIGWTYWIHGTYPFSFKRKT